MVIMDDKEKSLVPALRFGEFDGEWEEKKLGDIAIFSKGKGISKADIALDGVLECIRYGELYTSYNEVIHKIKSRTNLDKKELVISEYNDVIIPASGEAAIDIATASCVLKKGVALSGDLNIVRTPLNGVFLSYYMNNTKKLSIARLAQGVSVVHLYSKQLKTLKLNIPIDKEQQKIANFLSSVDKKIEQLRQKVSLLEDYKKGVMQQIFSQQIRFKDDNGEAFSDWEIKRLGEVAKKVNLKNKSNVINFVLTNSATQGIVSQQDYFDKNIANQNNLEGYYIVDKDDFVYNPRISTSAPVGPIKRNCLRKGVMSPLYTIFRFNKGDLKFLEYFFETTGWHKYMKSIANYGARHDRMNITSIGFQKMPIPFPELKEQQKIANYLSSLDEKIEQTKTQLKQAQQFKKGLLQQLFV